MAEVTAIIEVTLTDGVDLTLIKNGKRRTQHYTNIAFAPVLDALTELLGAHASRGA